MSCLTYCRHCGGACRAAPPLLAGCALGLIHTGSVGGGDDEVARMAGYFDISPEITADIAVFPGDTPYRRTPALAFAHGDHLALSKIETTLHLGAHADAPSHYRADGVGISQRPLERYYGPCQVVQVKLPRGQRVAPSHLQGVAIQAPRVLLRTDSFLDYNHWCNDFNALSPELIEHLARHEVGLVGIDTPSVDLADDASLHSHNAIAAHDMAILEGLVLRDVPPGVYHLCALPLRLRDADASPVRAVLWKT